MDRLAGRQDGAPAGRAEVEEDDGKAESRREIIDQKLGQCGDWGGLQPRARVREDKHKPLETSNRDAGTIREDYCEIWKRQKLPITRLRSTVIKHNNWPPFISFLHCHIVTLSTLF